MYFIFTEPLYLMFTAAQNCSLKALLQVLSIQFVALLKITFAHVSTVLLLIKELVMKSENKHLAICKCNKYFRKQSDIF